MYECILVSAPWCAACKPMKEWWESTVVSGVKFRIVDAEEKEVEGLGICSLPTIIVKDYKGDIMLQESGARRQDQVIETLRQLGV